MRHGHFAAKVLRWRFLLRPHGLQHKDNNDSPGLYRLVDRIDGAFQVAALCSNLRYVELHAHDIRDDESYALQHGLRNLPGRVEQLRLHWRDIEGDLSRGWANRRGALTKWRMDDILRAIAHCRTLIRLDLRVDQVACAESGDPVIPVAIDLTRLRVLPALKHLSLDADISVVAATEAADKILAFPSLQTLRLRCNGRPLAQRGLEAVLKLVQSTIVALHIDTRITWQINPATEKDLFLSSQLSWSTPLLQTLIITVDTAYLSDDDAVSQTVEAAIHPFSSSTAKTIGFHLRGDASLRHFEAVTSIMSSAESFTACQRLRITCDSPIGGGVGGEEWHCLQKLQSGTLRHRGITLTVHAPNVLRADDIDDEEMPEVFRAQWAWFASLGFLNLPLEGGGPDDDAEYEPPADNDADSSDSDDDYEMLLSGMEAQDL